MKGGFRKFFGWPRTGLQASLEWRAQFLHLRHKRISVAQSIRALGPNPTWNIWFTCCWWQGDVNICSVFPQPRVSLCKTFYHRQNREWKALAGAITRDLDSVDPPFSGCGPATSFPSPDHRPGSTVAFMACSRRAIAQTNGNTHRLAAESKLDRGLPVFSVLCVTKNIEYYVRSWYNTIAILFDVQRSMLLPIHLVRNNVIGGTEGKFHDCHLSI